MRPAATVRSTLEAWTAHVAAAGGRSATTLDGARLAAGPPDLPDALRAVQAGHIACLRIGAADAPPPHLVHPLLPSAHLRNLCAAGPPEPAHPPAAAARQRP